MAVALYARKSIEREGSISCETQLDYCRAMLKPEERRQKIHTFVDNGYSGSNTDREGFREMMKLVERGKINKIIVYRLDRISRSLSDFITILDTLKRNHVAFVSSQESFDTSSSYGEMIVKILMVFAEFERNSIIERVTQAYHHRAEQRFYMGGRRPYGFILTETTIGGIKTKMLSPNPSEIDRVKTIFENYAVPGVTLRRVTVTHEAADADTFVFAGKGWGHGVGISQYGTLDLVYAHCPWEGRHHGAAAVELGQLLQKLKEFKPCFGNIAFRKAELRKA